MKSKIMTHEKERERNRGHEGLYDVVYKSIIYFVHLNFATAL